MRNPKSPSFVSWKVTGVLPAVSSGVIGDQAIREDADRAGFDQNAPAVFSQPVVDDLEAGRIAISDDRLDRSFSIFPLRPKPDAVDFIDRKPQPFMMGMVFRVF